MGSQWHTVMDSVVVLLRGGEPSLTSPPAGSEAADLAAGNQCESQETRCCLRTEGCEGDGSVHCFIFFCLSDFFVRGLYRG